MDSGYQSILTQPRAPGWRIAAGGPVRAGWLVAPFAAVVCMALPACAPAPRRAEAPAPGPATQAPRATVPAGAREFTVDPDASVVTMLVRRGGKFSGLGHVHVVTSADESGRVWFGTTQDLSGFEVRVPVDAFVVDDPAARVDPFNAGQCETPMGRVCRYYSSPSMSRSSVPSGASMSAQSRGSRPRGKRD